MRETRKIAAIICSDVVGYSRLAGADEDRILARLRALRSDLIDPTIAVHHGRVVKRTGDGLIVEFRSVVDAVRCAIEVQNAMVERNAGVPEDRRIVFRMGIHLGDVVEESDGDLMGDGVNIAARLEGIAAPGAICLSEQAYWQVKGRLDLAVTDLGPTDLKNIAEPIRVYSLQVGVPAQAKPAEPVTPPAPTPQKRRFGLVPLAAALAALLVVVAGGAWWLLNANRPASVVAKTPAEAARLSIVVTPFANLSGDPAQDYLVDALTDELTTSLARMRDTFVIARNTAMTFKGMPIDVKAIGKDLGVRYVLEGSVQPSGDRMRVNAQLIDAGSGAHLWAEQFDTPRADLLRTQDAIVAHLANTLDLQLQQAYVAGVKRTPVANRDAEDLALQCSEGMWKAGLIGKEADAAFALCEQALAIDPNNVRALMALGAKFWVRAVFHVSGDRKGDLARADELESKAVALDPDWTWTHMQKGAVLRVEGRPGEAVAEQERALALDPSNVTAAADLGFDHANLGQFDKSLEYLDRAILASPHDRTLRWWYGAKAEADFALKRYDQAIESARRAIAINPDYNAFAHAMLVAALALTDQDAEAREALQRYL
ncbi:MAG: adenylate/guanylate cyclase domain-containing protein, partial [Roseiarcus sp.]|uniref:adenylate/guanylate cyclase domain-containing protein n=1 Tax=Roseiarcus sp. TaxID=1969460 RepID=UPI003C44AD36